MAGQPPTPPRGDGCSADGPPANTDAGGDGTGGFLSRWSRRKVQVRQGATPADLVVAPLPGRVVSVPAAPPAAHAAMAPTAPLPPSQRLQQPQQLQQLQQPQQPQQPPPPAPTLADVALLGRESDYARFVVPGVDAGVRNAALKKLFTDPHFNLMDGLDTYIDDYGKPDPLPAGMLRQMAQSHALGLFDDEQPPGAPTVRLHAGAGPGAEPAAHPDAANSPDNSADNSADNSSASRPDPTPALAHEPDRTPDEDADLRLQPHPAAGPAGPDPGAVPDAGRQH